MRAISVCISICIASTVAGADPDYGPVKKLFESDNYSATWGTTPTYASDAELEIGTGNGHGGTLGWMRFKPGKDGVDVLDVKFDEGWHPYKSKHPPDKAPVTVKAARFSSDGYTALLKNLAVVDAAILTPRETDRGHSTSDFWVSARLTVGKKMPFDLDWAGYWASKSEVDFAKPNAAVKLTKKAVEKLDFKDHKLTDADRAWASAKFVNDWKKYKNLSGYSWVCGRYIETIGVVGDSAALPTLREILTENKGGEYYAINAVTRLTGKDVRDKPVEEMDIEKVRPKVLELLKEKK
ncbi:hypothetical protein [Limnoglobus roseus]|uniref:Uncharacterized protein n=1 Tax=Limnoglobus roseus TaxID=2598579 RepID=A0A5C1ANT4_9BACT|nr:hypothetical protein [Limnoglobus roseus]QEL19807.1 hypothetical protein PX52LOC_06887 [Limnoglobus roseus]